MRRGCRVLSWCALSAASAPSRRQQSLAPLRRGLRPRFSIVHACSCAAKPCIGGGGTQRRGVSSQWPHLSRHWLSSSISSSSSESASPLVDDCIRSRLCCRSSRACHAPTAAARMSGRISYYGAKARQSPKACAWAAEWRLRRCSASAARVGIRSHTIARGQADLHVRRADGVFCLFVLKLERHGRLVRSEAVGQKNRR